MYRELFFTYYRIGRLIFVLALLIAFQMTGYFTVKSSFTLIFAAYGAIVVLRFFVKSLRGLFADFLVDILFISALVYVTNRTYSYENIFYLFPIFIGSVLLPRRLSTVLPCLATLLYGTVFYINTAHVGMEDTLNVLLHLLSFLFIALAGTYLRARLEKQEEQIRRLEEEKITMQGYERLFRVSADFAHELRNPLASISAAVQFLEKGQTDRVFIDMLSVETRRLSSLIDDFLIFSRPSDAPREIVDLSDMVKDLVGHYREKKKILSQVNEAAPVSANRRLIEIAINNVLKNAVEAAHSTVSCALDVSSSHRGTADGRVILYIEDDGPGVEEAIRDTIFEPFFTTKREGTGLGLAIAYRIIMAFNGSIRVERSSLGGAKFILSFTKESPKEP